MNRSIQRLYLGIIVAFALLAGFLAWWQVVRASSLASRVDNPYLYESQRKVDRGRILTADGVVLARSVKVDGGGETKYRRVYPRGTLAPHVVGYASQQLGASGIEAAYTTFLGGDYGAQPLLQRIRGAKHGANVQLTVDSRVQQAAVDALATIGAPGAVVAIRPSTGAILAMASNPSFNLNDVATDYAAITKRAGSPLLNRTTQSRQPPGSTFKVITASAAIQDGVATPSTQIVDTGSYVVNGIPIRNFGGQVFGRHDLTFALTHSVNTTFARLGVTLGADRLGERMDAFGFGRRPPLTDLPPSEIQASGRFRGTTLLSDTQPGEDVARIAIGQERVLATPLQMAMVAAAIADGGMLRQPYLVSRVRDRKGDLIRQVHPEELGQAIRSDVAADISAMMLNVVKEGTGTAAALSGLQVAGKTGTAEISATSGNMAWFIGFAPANNPKVAVAVRIENTPLTGGVVAAPVAAAVMKAALEAAR